MRSTAVRRTLGSLVLAAAIAGCDLPRLSAPETFAWGAQPISFSPPVGWSRSAHLEGGLRGVRFVKERSVGQAIVVAEDYLVGDRDRRAALEELLERFDRYDDRELRRALSLARCRTDDPLSPREAEVATEVNAALDRALVAHFADQPEAARAEIAAALAAARGLKLSLGDVLERVAFRPEGHEEPEAVRVLARRQVVVGGEPAAAVDYTRRLPNRLYRGREVYLMRDNHLFIATLFGISESRPLFDRLVASIAFPPRATRARS